MTNYSNSHTASGKGDAYDESFESRNYRKFVWQWEKRILDLVVSEEAPIASYLDFACGTGRVAAHLEEKVGSSTGIDVSESMLKVARANLIQTELLTANLLDGSPTSIDDRKFSLISSFRFFLNAEPPLRRAAMARLSNLLVDDGVLVFNNHLNRSSIRAAGTRAYTAVRHGDADRYPTMSRQDVNELLGAVGLTVESVHSFGIWPTAHTERTRLPIRVHDKIETVLGSIDYLKKFAAYEIYVARKAS